MRVNANDLAITGAQPRWLLVTILLPEHQTKAKYVQRIAREIDAACREIDVVVIGGHTEITYGILRPILVGTLVGEVEPRGLVTPQGAHPGDSLLLTKGVPIEATAILAREFPERSAGALNGDKLRQARSFLDEPGLSVLRDAKIALSTGKVTAMHDPTEGGLVTALWKLAQLAGGSFGSILRRCQIPALAALVCRVFGLDPLRAISSGALLLAASKTTAGKNRRALEIEGIVCAEIGGVECGPRGIWAISGDRRRRVKPPLRDEISRVFDVDSAGPGA